MEIYLYGGYYRKAAADLNQLLILDPHHATGYLNRGLVYATMTQRAMVYSNAESIRNLKSIGVVEVEEEWRIGGYMLALQDLNQAIELRSAISWDFIYRVYYRRWVLYSDYLERHEDAIRDYTTILDETIHDHAIFLPASLMPWSYAYHMSSVFDIISGSYYRRWLSYQALGMLDEAELDFLKAEVFRRR